MAGGRISMEFEQPIFEQISANQTVTEVESLCFSCGKNGTTRLMLTIIPFFGEVIITAFECPHCHFRNNGIQSASRIADRGVQYEVFIKSKKDLSRQIVKSEFASIRFPEIDLELPAKSGSGYLTTTEGLIGRVLEDMKKAAEDPLFKNDLASSARLTDIVTKLEEYLTGDKTFSFILDDLTGNSFVENFNAPRIDPLVKELRYRQDPKMLAELGFGPNQENSDENLDPEAQEEEEEAENVHSFNTKCPECAKPCKTRMTMVEIPYFKEVLLMATTCDYCGYRTNEVKTGGAISLKGMRIKLDILSIEDLSRDILKSETCRLSIPEIDLELQMGTLGGRFTTIEGLLVQVHKELEERVPFSKGDSATSDQKKIFSELLSNIKKICDGTLKCSVILEDPLSNSYIQSLYAPDPDPQLSYLEYERSEEQNDDLGISEMKTENY